VFGLISVNGTGVLGLVIKVEGYRGKGDNFKKSSYID
jgi:hypothetical protein